MPQYKRNGLPKTVLDRKLEVNGNATDIRTFLAEVFYRKKPNTYPEQSFLSSNQAREVAELETGQIITIGVLEIKRVK